MPATRCWCAASSPSGGSTRCRATGRSSTASPPSGRCSPASPGTPTCGSTPATSTSTSCAATVENAFAREGRTPPLPATVMCFGFKYGLPLDADLVVDARFLPNPHWIPELRPHDRPGRRGQRVRARPARRRRVPRPLHRRAAAARSPATGARASATSRWRSAAPAASTAAWPSPRSSPGGSPPRGSPPTPSTATWAASSGPASTPGSSRSAAATGWLPRWRRGGGSPPS